MVFALFHPSSTSRSPPRPAASLLLSIFKKNFLLRQLLMEAFYLHWLVYGRTRHRHALGHARHAVLLLLNRPFFFSIFAAAAGYDQPFRRA